MNEMHDLFENNKVFEENLPKYQELEFNNIHNDYWNVIVMNLVIFIMILSGIIIVNSFMIPTNFTLLESMSWALLIILIITVFLFVIYRIDFKKRAYVVRENDIIYRSGKFALTTEIVPFNRIQHIEITEGMFSRMYGLASIKVFTAGGDFSNLVINGLSKENAYKIKEYLVSKISTEEIQVNVNEEINLHDE